MTNSLCPSCGRPEDRAARLHDLQQRVMELEAENARLSEAARKFGELAERLNDQLREERRRAQERRPRERRGFGTSTD
jgi:hypothetical protein